MKRNLLVALLLLCTISFAYTRSQNTHIKPTGSYKFVGKTKTKGGDTYGYFGEIQVKDLQNNKIALTFYVNMGAPSYNSGSFIDTLDYSNNTAIYTNTEYDPSCKITFQFTAKGIFVKEQTDDYNSGCGFGLAVIADGFFKRVSSQIPILKDAATGEEVK